MADLPVEGPFTFEGTVVRGDRIELRYRIGPTGGPRPTWTFTEVVTLPAPLPAGPAADAAVRALHLAAGVSYYKCVAPVPLVVPPLSPAERALVEGLYDSGLREFAYSNGLAVPMPVEIVEDGAVGVAHHEAVAAGGPAGSLAGALVPIGGGKDSALVAALVPTGELFAVNPTGAQDHLADVLGRPLAVARRGLDPGLRELVAAGVPNGHVPVTAITSAIAVLAALALGRADVLMGIERSADEPSLVTADGVEVNHQWSKSSEGERLLSAVFEPTGVRYLSLLRPMTELAIGAAVAARGLAADIVSCNEVYRVWNPTTATEEQAPCGRCAKCLFTALMVAPASGPAEVAARYGGALLDRTDHVEAVRALWSDEKPFDCVGERLETAAAVALLAEREEWGDQVVVAALADEARALLAAAGVGPGDLLRFEGVDALPSDLRSTVAGLEAEVRRAVPAVRATR